MDLVHDMIKAFREKKGWSQQELAGRVGTSQSTINLWEKKKTKPKVENIPALASVMGVPIETLVNIINGHSEDLLIDALVVSEKENIYKSNARSVQPNIKELYVQLPFASIKAQAGIPESYEGCQLDWINETYPVIINHIAKKKQLVIEIDGESMTPGIVDGAHVLGEAVLKDNIKYESGGVYAVLFGNGRFVVKRIKTNEINTTGILTLWSDNETYGRIDIPANDIHCMWKIVGKVWEPMR